LFIFPPKIKKAAPDFFRNSLFACLPFPTPELTGSGSKGYSQPKNLGGTPTAFA